MTCFPFLLRYGAREREMKGEGKREGRVVERQRLKLNPTSSLVESCVAYKSFSQLKNEWKLSILTWRRMKISNEKRTSLLKPNDCSLLPALDVCSRPQLRPSLPLSDRSLVSHPLVSLSPTRLYPLHSLVDADSTFSFPLSLSLALARSPSLSSSSLVLSPYPSSLLPLPPNQQLLYRILSWLPLEMSFPVTSDICESP